MDISKIINLDINLQTGAVEKAGFGILLLAGAHAGFADRAKSYTKATDLTDDHFNSNHAVYKAVSAYFSQKPKPTSIKIGRQRLATAVCRVVTVADSTDYTHTVDGVDYTYTSGIGATLASIATGIVGLINAAYAPSIATALTDGIYTIALNGATAALDLPSAVDGSYLTQNVAGRFNVSAYDALTTYQVTVNGEDYTAIAQGTAALTADSLATDIIAGTEDCAAYAYHDGASDWFYVVSTQDGSDITAEADTDGTGTGAIALTYPGVTESWATALSAIQDADDAWYGISILNRNSDQQLTVAAYIEQKIKIFGCVSADPNIPDTTVTYDTTTIIAQCKALSYFRTWVQYHADSWGGAADQWSDVSWFGRMLTFDPDVETAAWAYWTLTSVTTDNLTSTQETNCYGDLLLGSGGKNCNTYETVGGSFVTMPGKVAAGEWIAIITGRDWLYSRITESVLYAYTNNAKIPFTDAGIALIKAQITTWFEKGIQTEYLFRDAETYGAPGYSVTAPKRVDISTSDLANHILKDVEGNATVAGAILVTSMTVNLSV